MLEHIGQALLDDPIQDRFDQRWQATRFQARTVEVHLHPGALGPLLEVISQRDLESEVIQRRGAEFEGQVMHLLADQVGDLL